MKRIIAILAVTALMLTAASCVAGAPAQSTVEQPAATAAAADATESTMLELTLDELKQYDGKNGNPAYVAVDGIIYNLTNLAKWSGGNHNGYSAGNDLTDIIKNKSPHGVRKLEGVQIVGKLVEG